MARNIMFRNAYAPHTYVSPSLPASVQPYRRKGFARVGNIDIQRIGLRVEEKRREHELI